MLGEIIKTSTEAIFVFHNKLGDDYYEVLNYIFSDGRRYKNEREQEYVEANPITIIVKNPDVSAPGEILPTYFVSMWGESFINDYANKLLNGLPEEGMDYSYGERLHESGQLANVIAKLEEWEDTRQATCVLYRPEDTTAEHPPCMTVIDFKIRRDEQNRKVLNTFAWFRSNDMQHGYPANYYGILVVAWYVADKLGVELGKITTRSESAHVYTRY